jgi:prepilin-type N-terminal cleavage/methylation domain-containing protein
MGNHQEINPGSSHGEREGEAPRAYARGGGDASPGELMSKRWHTNGGFTAIEAIMVIVIIGVLASALIYRYNLSHDTGATVASDELIAEIQYVQARAMAAGAQQSISFAIGSGIYNLPGGQERLPDGITVTGTTLPSNVLTFNTMGEPTFGNSDRTITLAGSRTLTIYAITGKAE